MKTDSHITRAQAPAPVSGVSSTNGSFQTDERLHPQFRVALYAANLLLVLAIVLAAYSAVWEYSTRRYLKGFSDAVAPASAPPIEKIEAILNWMARGPARRETGVNVAVPDRDPTDTLNYAALLGVCGSATNAFVNLADSAGLPARRLLLLDERHLTKHVVAEVRVDDRWIVVDPVFRLIPRGAQGQLLTREDLANPAVLAAATHGVPNYLPEYTFDRTTHFRMARIPLVGAWLGDELERLIPAWDDSILVSLLAERESLAWLAFSIALAAFLALLRIVMRWYGEQRLGVRSVRIRTQLRQALHSFLDTTGYAPLS